ncbi:hypothetical protein X746_09965 [Mesorhizobium sp. LNJC380A00]|nr:hypothetical protein X746_09965 [Mesorhizobium sp. LNJC380A00]
MLSDGLPVAGRTAVEELYVHGGMGPIGMHAAPATARWLEEAVVRAMAIRSRHGSGHSDLRDGKGEAARRRVDLARHRPEGRAGLAR